jgi:hypothetical protein
MKIVKTIFISLIISSVITILSTFRSGFGVTGGITFAGFPVQLSLGYGQFNLFKLFLVILINALIYAPVVFLLSFVGTKNPKRK